MAYWSEEEREFHHENSTKKHVAASAHKQRTHCGKGGCKLPSDFMTKKEINAMNGEAKTFNLNKPMYWDMFESMPDDLKKEYITGLRERFDVPDNKIAEMFGVGGNTISRFFKCYGLAVAHKRGNRNWDEEGWDRWRGAIVDLAEVPAEFTVEAESESDSKTPVETVEEEIDITVETKVEENQGRSCDHTERKRAIPLNGRMVFNGTIDEIVESLRLILGNSEVGLIVDWSIIDRGDGVCKKEG